MVKLWRLRHEAPDDVDLLKRTHETVVRLEVLLVDLRHNIDTLHAELDSHKKGTE